jgi:hypothetical protein
VRLDARHLAELPREQVTAQRVMLQHVAHEHHQTVSALASVVSRTIFEFLAPIIKDFQR